MHYQSRNTSFRTSVVIFLFLNAAAAAVAAQTPDSFVSNGTPKIFLKKNIRQNEDAKLKQFNSEALESLKRSLLSSPKDPVLYNNLGTLHARLKNYDEALIALKKAIALKPDFANAYFNLSIVYDHLERYAEAVAAIEKALAIDAANVTARTERCRLLFALKNFAAAAPCYEKLIGATPPDSRSRISYGIALVQIEQFEKALPVMEETVRLFPEDVYAHNALGMLLFTKKKYRRALECFRRALDLNGDFEPSRYNLAVAQIALNDRTAALRQYARLKKSNPRFAAALYKILYRDKIVDASK